MSQLVGHRHTSSQHWIAPWKDRGDVSVLMLAAGVAAGLSACMPQSIKKAEKSDLKIGRGEPVILSVTDTLWHQKQSTPDGQGNRPLLVPCRRTHIGFFTTAASATQARPQTSITPVHTSRATHAVKTAGSCSFISPELHRCSHNHALCSRRFSECNLAVTLPTGVTMHLCSHMRHTLRYVHFEVCSGLPVHLPKCMGPPMLNTAYKSCHYEGKLQGQRREMGTNTCRMCVLATSQQTTQHACAGTTL